VKLDAAALRGGILPPSCRCYSRCRSPKTFDQPFGSTVQRNQALMSLPFSRSSKILGVRTPSNASGTADDHPHDHHGPPSARYDHRLRDLVPRTRDVTIATDLGVPRSTARGWIGKAPNVVVSPGVTDLRASELQQEVLKLRRHVRKLTALLRLALAVLRSQNQDLAGSGSCPCWKLNRRAFPPRFQVESPALGSWWSRTRRVTPTLNVSVEDDSIVAMRARFRH
jgi:hypothetical protein